MSVESPMQPIVVYLIEHHPLEPAHEIDGFHWLPTQDGLRLELEGLLGSYKTEDVTMLVDSQPAGPAWQRLLKALLHEQVSIVVTHLAPLSAAQRQQLIGLCDQAGAQLVTPADAGRNRAGQSQGPAD
jgi:hypothetical protein